MRMGRGIIHDEGRDSRLMMLPDRADDGGMGSREDGGVLSAGHTSG